MIYHFILNKFFYYKFIDTINFFVLRDARINCKHGFKIIQTSINRYILSHN